MKKKIVIVLLSMFTAVIILNGCGKTEHRRADKNIARAWENEDAVHGEVSKLTGDTITIKVTDGGKEPMEDKAFTGEEQEIMITKDTVVMRRNMQGRTENGNALQTPNRQWESEDGEMPEKPKSRQEMEEGETPREPEGKAPAGEKPDMEDHSEEITLSDISVGDMVMVICTDDNHAAEITVMPSGKDKEKGETPQSEEANQEGATV